MQFTTRKSGRDRLHARIESENLETLYPHNVAMYYLPPTQDIKLPLLDEIAIERLKALRILEQATSKNPKVLSSEWKEDVEQEFKAAGLKTYVRLLTPGTSKSDTSKEQDLQARRKDYISHFFLRLLYCRSTEMRRWFISREMELFKLKFSKISSSERQRYLEINKLDYQPIPDQERDQLQPKLIDCLSKPALFNDTQFYRVHFTEVPDLVKSRRCFVKGGFAYVSSEDFVSIVAGIHEACIENGLAAAARVLPEIENDERIYALLNGLDKSYTGRDYIVASSEKVPIECIDQLSIKSFPLCMRQCHETLRAKHHLKHHGRLQYGLFLKGIGVTLEDALRFWREEFTKMMDLDKFERGYAYNIRYNYGKEGKQRDWVPHSCLKIISNGGGPNEVHGCPFKWLDAQSLRAKLTAYGFAAAHAQEVLSFASKGHYQLACNKYFEIMHETTLDEGISHPNQYFEKSQAIINGRTTNDSKSDVGKTPKSQRTQRMGRDVALKQHAKSMIDEYDDELWNATQAAELKEMSRVDTANWANDEDDIDMSQVQDY